MPASASEGSLVVGDLGSVQSELSPPSVRSADMPEVIPHDEHGPINSVQPPSSSGSASGSIDAAQIPIHPASAVDPSDHTSLCIDPEPSNDSSDDGEDEDEDEEPALKYSRLKGRLSEVLVRDTASTITVSPQVLALGTHNGVVHLLTYEGSRVNSFRAHAASVTCLRLDEENDFVATASVEGRVVIHSLTSAESYAFDYKRPMQAVALEPEFGRKSTRAFACGGMAGNLILQEKGWLGYKEQVIHSGEGPIWAIEWKGNLIAWANDHGVKIYDTNTTQRIGYIDRGAQPPRAEMFKCSLVWKDDHTLLIGWADQIKIVRVRQRAKAQTASGLPPLTVEMTAIYQVDCMISGIVPYQASYLILAYIPPDTYENEATDNPLEQRRKAGNRPELRIIDKGEETSADALGLTNFHTYGCNDYTLVKSQRPGEDVFFVVSPSDVVVVRPRDASDHVEWLVGRERFEEALTAAEQLRDKHGSVVDVMGIGLKYMHHLFDIDNFSRTAGLVRRVLAVDGLEWERWIDLFIKADQLNTLLEYIPVRAPQLGRCAYDRVLSHLLTHDRPGMIQILKRWPADIYDSDKLLRVVQAEVEIEADLSLLECLAELHLVKGQPSRALPFFLQLRRPEVFDLIRQYSLFTAVQERVFSLVEFGQERAIQLLIDHIHSVPIERVVAQLQSHSRYLFWYLDALFDKDPQLCLPFSDRMVALYADYNAPRLISFLRTSTFYDLEKAYGVCRDKDYVPEMVFLLGRMGNSRQALMLIIERLGDVQMAIDFAKEQADEDLWEDLLQYSESRPDFIRALLQCGGIDPTVLVQRIRDGMEIPGLKPALVKILQASNLQVSLLEGCQHILNSDGSALASELQVGQTGSGRGSPSSTCRICGLPAFASSEAVMALLYLCRHLVHATCALPPDGELPDRSENMSVSQLLSTDHRRGSRAKLRELGAKLSYAAAVRVRASNCPVCTHSRGILA